MSFLIIFLLRDSSLSLFSFTIFIDFLTWLSLEMIYECLFEKLRLARSLFVNGHVKLKVKHASFSFPFFTKICNNIHCSMFNLLNVNYIFHSSIVHIVFFLVLPLFILFILYLLNGFFYLFYLAKSIIASWSLQYQSPPNTFLIFNIWLFLWPIYDCLILIKHNCSPYLFL